MLVVNVLIVFHKVGWGGCTKLHLASYFVVGTRWSSHHTTWIVVLRIFSITPIFMVENSIWRHRHIVMSNIKLVLSFILLALNHIESHSSDIIFWNVHFVWSLFILRWELLANVSSIECLTICCLVLGKRATSEIGLIHLHGMHLLPILSHHVHSGASTAAIRGSASIWHSPNEALTLKTHSNGHIISHLVHLLKVNAIHSLQRVHLLINHIVDAHLWFSSTLLRGHW